MNIRLSTKTINYFKFMIVNINGFDFNIRSSFGLKTVLSILHQKSITAFSKNDVKTGEELLNRCFEIEKEYNSNYDGVNQKN